MSSFHHSRSTPKKTDLSAFSIDNADNLSSLAHYMNDKPDKGWTIIQDECTAYIRKFVKGCQGDNQDSHGGYWVDDTLGSAWVDPNAV